MSDKAIAPTSDYQVGQVIDRGALPVAEVTGRVRRIQEVMKALMKEGTHYGTIPGTPKPTLYQPGAELLCVTFRIAANPRVEDLSTDDAIRYRVTMAAVSQVTGEALGEGVGECSSNETKYRWMRPTCDEEFAETPDELKREKWLRGKNGNYKAKQIRTSPADIANTILKMAYKRALISMTRTVLACSDQFAQDLEDLPEEVREAVAHDDAPPPVHPPQRKSQATPTPEPVEDDGALRIRAVKLCHYQKKDGGEGKFWAVTFSNGKEAATFDIKIAEAAAVFQADGAIVEAALEHSSNGKLKLTELSRVMA